MVAAKEIRNKIKSIKSTQKITKAMELVAASKMRKAQERMTTSKPYSEKIRSVIKHVSQAQLDDPHPLTIKRDIKTVGYLVITTDRGLCGGLNINLFKKLTIDVKNNIDSKIESKFLVLGNKGISFFKSFGGDILASKSGLGDKPDINDIVGFIKIIKEEFLNGSIDQFNIVYNEFINTMAQKPVIKNLLPIEKSLFEDHDELSKNGWDYIYEPSSDALLDILFERFLENQAYHGLVENIASEQAARMIAMKAATDNAGDLISELQKLYNKARQASITQEIAEIISGAAAV